MDHIIAQTMTYINDESDGDALGTEWDIDGTTKEAKKDQMQGDRTSKNRARTSTFTQWVVFFGPYLDRCIWFGTRNVLLWDSFADFMGSIWSHKIILGLRIWGENTIKWERESYLSLEWALYFVHGDSIDESCKGEMAIYFIMYCWMIDGL